MCNIFQDMLKFKESIGEDAETVDLSGSGENKEIWIQLQSILQPGDATFDGTFRYNLMEKRFSIEVVHIKVHQIMYCLICRELIV